MNKPLVFAFLCVASSALAQGSAPYCVYLDRWEEPAWEMSAAYATREAANKEDLGLLSLQAGAGMRYFRTPLGDLDLRVDAELLQSIGKGGLEVPDAFGHVYADLKWLHRRYDGFSTRVSLQPGYYGEYDNFSADALTMPFAIEGIQSFTDTFSILVGLAVFPEFDHVVDPRIGLRWVPADEWFFDLAYPETRVSYQYGFEYSIYAGFEIDNTSEYAMEDDDPRGNLIAHGSRYFAGFTYTLPNEMRAIYEIGLLKDRTLEYEHGDGEYDWDDGYYLKVGLGGAF